MKRTKADPRQLCFVFQSEVRSWDGGAGVDIGGRLGTGAIEADLADLPLFAPGGKPAPRPTDGAGSPHGISKPAEPKPAPSPERAAPASELLPGTPSAIAAAHLATYPLSGPDPGLSALCASWLDEFGMGELGKKLKVVWNRRFTSAAGLARYEPSRIELNPALVEFEGEIERTLKHELAHLVARCRNPKKKIRPHGAEWRQACADLGIHGEAVYHNLPFRSRRRKRNHAYRCAGCSEVITRVRPLNGHCACYSCCKKFNRGRYDPRFKLRKISVPDDSSG